MLSVDFFMAAFVFLHVSDCNSNNVPKAAGAMSAKTSKLENKLQTNYKQCSVCIKIGLLGLGPSLALFAFHFLRVE